MSVSPLNSASQGALTQYLDGLRDLYNRPTSSAVEPTAARVASSLQAAQHPPSLRQVAANTVQPFSRKVAPPSVALSSFSSTQSREAIERSQSSFAAASYPPAPPHPLAQQLAAMLPSHTSLNYQA
jgi:hypothetical protein